LNVRKDIALAALALAVLALAAALVAAFVAVGRGDDAQPAPSAVDGPIVVATSLSPRLAAFGDTLTARLDVTVDRSEVDPDLVKVQSTFKPWKLVGEPTRERADVGSVTYLRTTYVLRCLIALCVPADETARYDFRRARVTYDPPSGEGGEALTVDTFWPALFVTSRLDAASFSERDPLSAPWRADVLALPSVTYRIRPALLVVLLGLGGIVLLGVASVLGYRALPARREPPPPPPPPPPPVLSALEQALRLLETPPVENGVADRRRALELVADEIAAWGDRRLEGRARALAWSPETPALEATRTLAATVRELVPVDEEESEESEVEDAQPA
jgi:hypothetical protein